MITDNILASPEIEEQKDHERKQFKWSTRLDQGRKPTDLTIIPQPKCFNGDHVSRRIFKQNFE
jgi:hypothetical protein